MPMADIRTRVTLDRAKFQRGLAKIKWASRDFAKKFAGFAKDMVRGAVAIGLGLAAAGIAAAAFVRGVSKAGQEIKRLSDTTGLTVEQLSTLQTMVRTSGAELKDFTETFANMQTAIDQGANGSKRYSEALAAIGLSAEKLQGMKADERFTAIAEGLAAIPDAGKRASMAIKIFGEESGKKLLPVLSTGVKGFRDLKKEAQDTAWTKEQAEGADALERSFASLWNNISAGLREAIDFRALGKAVMWVRDQVRDLRKSAKFKEMRDDIVKFTTTSIKKLWSLANTLYKLAQVWGLLSSEVKDKLKNILANTAVFAVAWKSGMLQLFATTIGAVIKMFSGTLVPAIALAMSALGGLFVGLKLGDALEDSFDLSGLLLKVQVWAQKTFELLGRAAEFGISLALDAGRRIREALKGNKTESMFQELVNEAGADFATILDEWERMSDEIDKQSTKNGKTFAENLKEQVGKAKDDIVGEFDLIKKKLKLGDMKGIADAFKAAFEKAKDLPDLKLDNLLGDALGNAKEIGAEINSWTQPFRGLDRLVEKAAEGAKKAGNKIKGPRAGRELQAQLKAQNARFEKSKKKGTAQELFADAKAVGDKNRKAFIRDLTTGTESAQEKFWAKAIKQFDGAKDKRDKAAEILAKLVPINREIASKVGAPTWS